MAVSSPISCLNPTWVYNKYSGDPILAPCGCCFACTNRKASHNTTLVRLEAKSAKFTLFVTLTYAQEHIPLLHFIKSDIASPAPLYDVVNAETGEIHSKLHIKHYDEILAKANVHGKFPDNTLPYLSKHDLQKFLKRFRQSLSRCDASRIRHYSVGEYGPTTFRPHFHCLFFINDKKTLSQAFTCIRKSWKFGRVDVQLATKDPTKYLARYVSGNSTLPKIYKELEVQPFSVHSSFLGKKFFQSQREEVYKASIAELMSRSIEINGQSKVLHMWSSYYSYFFPRCASFNTLAPSERYDAYTIYPKLQQRYLSAATSFDIAKAVVHEFTTAHTIPDWLRSFVELSYKMHECIRDPYYDLRSIPINGDVLKYYNSVYRNVLLSKHFINFCCNGDSGLFSIMLTKIELFYLNLDQLHLNQWYKSMEEYAISNISDSFIATDSNTGNTFFPLFYTETYFDDRRVKDRQHPFRVEDFINSQLYKEFSARERTIYDNNIKHKKLNDANKIFC